MNNELERTWLEAVVAYFKVLSSIFLEELKKTMKTSIRITDLWAEI
jgi:hypothetical protein